MDDDEPEVMSSSKAAPFTDSRRDIAALMDIRKRIRKKLPVDTDAVYGRLLATPGWFYTSGMSRDWKDVVDSLTGQSATGSTPLYAAVLRAMATQLLLDDVTAHRGLVLLLSLARVSGHWGLNLVQVYQELAARFDFTVVVTAEAAELADHPRVPNNTFSIAIHGDRTLKVRLTAGQRGGALILMDDEQRASWVALRDNLRRHAAEIEDEIAGIGRLQRDVRYDREAGRHRRQEAVNSTMDWAGPSGKRLRGSVTGEATGLKRQRVGAPAMYTDLVAEHAAAQAVSQRAAATAHDLADARTRLHDVNRRITKVTAHVGDGQQTGAGASRLRDARGGRRGWNTAFPGADPRPWTALGR